MTIPAHFPTLRIGVLQSLKELKEQFAADDSIFEQTGCPYDRETVEILKSILQVTVRVETVEKLVQPEIAIAKRGGLTDEDVGIVEEELRTCLSELRSLGKEVEGVARVDEDTHLKIIKAKASLIEQIVKLRERVMNVRRQAEFEGTVMGILEELVGEDDRTEFLRRLAPFREG